MINIYKAPEEVSENISIFLAGTIDDGNSINWQDEVSNKIKENLEEYNINIFNPRRDNWNTEATKEDVIDQIKWEHKYLDKSDIIIMNILADSKSPISLMEIGMYASSGKLIVFCPESFYRFENVLCVCNKYGVELFNTNDVDYIVDIIKDKILFQ